MYEQSQILPRHERGGAEPDDLAIRRLSLDSKLVGERDVAADVALDLATECERLERAHAAGSAHLKFAAPSTIYELDSRALAPLAINQVGSLARVADESTARRRDVPAAWSPRVSHAIAPPEPSQVRTRRQPTARHPRDRPSRSGQYSCARRRKPTR